MREGWEVKKLGEVCELINRGVSPKYIDNNGIVVLNQKCIRDHKISFEQSRFHDNLLKRVSPEKVIRKGDVLINSTGTGTLGRVAQVRDEINNVTVDSHITIIRPLQNLFFDDFFGWALINIEDEITKRGEGCGGQTELARSTLKNDFIISFPKSLLEQQHIVSILDEAFAAIDQAKTNVERNSRSVKELFQSELNSIFTNKGEGWVEKKLGNITTKVGSGATPRGGNESYKSEGISLIRSMNVHDRYFKEKNLAFIDDKQAKELSGVTVEEGDVLLNITGASVARCCVILPRYLPARVNQHVSIIRTIKEIVDPSFLNFLLTSKFYKDQLLETGEQGATRQAITKVQLMEFIIRYPSLTEQKKIVFQLNTLSTETQKLEKLYQQKLNELEALKKSILQKAFSGELSNKSTVSKQVNLPVVISDISITDLHAGIIALSLKRHEEANAAHTFHHVKSEKIVHLIESHLGIDLNRTPIQDAAGPNDFPLKIKVESRAQKAGFFYVNESGGIKSYVKGSQFEKLINKVTDSLQSNLSEVYKLIDLIVPMKTQQAEIVATVYAAWNNLLLENKDITDETIVKGARENWHENKLKIPREKFFKAIIWMREKNLIPKGTGKKVVKKA